MRGESRMVTKVIRELICDLCGSNEGVRKWRIQSDTGRKASPDLCAKDAKVLEQVLKKVPAGTGKRSTPRPVLTEAQIRAKRVKKTS